MVISLRGDEQFCCPQKSLNKLLRYFVLWLCHLLTGGPGPSAPPFQAITYLYVYNKHIHRGQFIRHTLLALPAAARIIDARQDASMLSCCLCQTLTNVTAEIETHRSRQHFYSLPLCNCGEPMPTVASVSFS